MALVPCLPFTVALVVGLHVGVGDVAPHHAVGVEVVGVLADGVLHHTYPGFAVVVIDGYDFVLKFMIQVFRVNSIDVIIRSYS